MYTHKGSKKFMVGAAVIVALGLIACLGFYSTSEDLEYKVLSEMFAMEDEINNGFESSVRAREIFAKSIEDQRAF
jgi:hypothetical protein